MRRRPVPGAPIRARPSYRCENLKLIVEFDGYPHYQIPATILQDWQQDAIYRAMGYRVVRLPYFVRMSPEVARHVFGSSNGCIEPSRVQGFIDDDDPLPAAFCSLGVERFMQDLRGFHFIAADIVQSLRDKVRIHGDARLVVPAALLELVSETAPEPEGVIKFHLEFRESSGPAAGTIAGLNAWRTVLHVLGLTSQDPLRYGGVAYGNVSQRASGAPAGRSTSPQFIVSGTQTGGLDRLTERHYCLVTGFDLYANRLRAEGPIAPSSESLTHAAVYRAAPSARCVLHVHSPEIWRHAKALQVPVVDPKIAYGTPEMADAVGALVRRHQDAIVAMGGHEDGIIAYGSSLDDTALKLIGLFVRASLLKSRAEQVRSCNPTRIS